MTVEFGARHFEVVLASDVINDGMALEMKEGGAIATTIPDRVAWAVRQLTPEPTDHVLEVGCGTGVAAALLCEHLPHGRVTAIDRSATMVAAAARRLAPYTGRARLHHVALAEADFASASFDRALAINVNAFWRDPTADLAVLARVLRPRGLLCLVYQPPTAAQVEAIAAACAGFLRAHGFGQVRVGRAGLRPTPAVCITGQARAA